MSDPKPSVAEMVEVFLRMGKAGHYTTALLEDIVFAARAEAVAPLEARVKELEAALRGLVEASVRCGACGETATKFSEFSAVRGRRPVRAFRCDSCARFTGDTKDMSYAAPLRAALALLAADQADEKAGKP